MTRETRRCEWCGDILINKEECECQAAIEIGDLRAVLKALVDLKALKERIEAADLCTYGVADAEAAQNMADEYARRKPIAWQAARDMVSNAEVTGQAGAAGEGPR